MTAGTAGDAATMHHTYNVPIARNRTEKMPSSLAHRWRLNTRPTDDDDMQMVSQFLIGVYIVPDLLCHSINRIALGCRPIAPKLLKYAAAR